MLPTPSLYCSAADVLSLCIRWQALATKAAHPYTGIEFRRTQTEKLTEPGIEGLDQGEEHLM